MTNKDEFFMNIALSEAEKAGKLEEIPVGCVIVQNDIILAKGFNLREQSKNPLAHAEIIAINRASKALGTWRLEDVTLYVTLEPCPMCAGAIVQARIKRLVYGTEDLKTGAVKSLMNITEDKRLNHQVDVTGGILKDKCSFLLKNFFRKLRKKIK